MKRRASLHNLGCKVNAYETEAMQQLLERAGYQIVPFGEPADVCIINTCSVTNVADKKSRQMIHRARAKNSRAVIVAAGCYVQSSEEELRRDASADILIGNNRKKELVEILDEYFSRREREDKKKEDLPVYVSQLHKPEAYEELSVSRVSGHVRAFIKVQDGCNQFCSYCIIPYTRGRVRSRRPEAVKEEVRKLADAGYREIVVTGIHLSSYGTDFAKEEGASLLSLIGGLHEIAGIERIRLGSLEPRIVTREFAKALSGLPKVCPHFHLSLQSGCGETLKRMNRHYTPEEFLQGCGYLREAFGHPAITTDVIVGFPGETEEEFAATRRFLEQAGFFEMHIFKYSRREGTRAAGMPGQVPEPVKARRSEDLFKLEKELSRAYRKSLAGKDAAVLLEEEVEINGKTYMMGHTGEYVKAAVCLEDLAGILGRERRGMLLRGKITSGLTDEILKFLPET